MVKKMRFGRMVTALSFSLFLLCCIVGLEILFSVDVLGVSLDTEGTGGG